MDTLTSHRIVWLWYYCLSFLRSFRPSRRGRPIEKKWATTIEWSRPLVPSILAPFRVEGGYARCVCVCQMSEWDEELNLFRRCGTSCHRYERDLECYVRLLKLVALQSPLSFSLSPSSPLSFSSAFCFLHVQLLLALCSSRPGLDIFLAKKLHSSFLWQCLYATVELSA